MGFDCLGVLNFQSFQRINDVWGRDAKSSLRRGSDVGWSMLFTTALVLSESGASIVGQFCLEGVVFWAWHPRSIESWKGHPNTLLDLTLPSVDLLQNVDWVETFVVVGVTVVVFSVIHQWHVIVVYIRCVGLARNGAYGLVSVLRPFCFTLLQWNWHIWAEDVMYQTNLTQSR